MSYRSLWTLVLLSSVVTAGRDAQEPSALCFGQVPPGDTPADPQIINAPVAGGARA